MSKKSEQEVLLTQIKELMSAYNKGYRSNPILDEIRPRVHKKQQWFLGMEHREVLYGGAAGGGKSDALLMAALQYIDIPGYAALLLRRTYADLEKSGALMDRAISWFSGTGLKKQEGGKRWVLPGGGKIEFGYMDSDADRFKYKCFHPETDILTSDGWKPVSQVQVGELVLTMSQETRKMTYRKVTETHKYRFKGKLIDFHSKFGVSFQVTPNHSVWASTPRNKNLKEYRADELPYVAKIPQVGGWEGVDLVSPQIFTSDGHNGRTITFTANQWLSFMGWYLSEGNCGNSTERKYEIKISQTSEPGRTIIRKLLSSVDGLNYQENDSGFTFYNKKLCSYLEQFGLSYDKFIPRNLVGLSRKQSLLLLDALVEGDGQWITDDNGVFCTSSERLKDDVMELAVYCGFRPTALPFTVLNYDRIYWRVSLFRCHQDTSTERTHKTRTLYDGNVYCVTVPPFHMVLIRHRGRVSWSGQSAEYQFCGYDELTEFPEEYYTYLFSRIRKPAAYCPLCFSSEDEAKTSKARKNCGTCKGLGINPLHFVPLRMRSASNPGGKHGDWVKKHFVPKGYLEADSERQFNNIWTKSSDCILCAGKKRIEVKGELTECVACTGTGSTQRFFVPARLEDNPVIQAGEYTQNLLLMNDDQQTAQLLHGRWDFMSDGTIFHRDWIKQYGWRGDHIELYNPEGKRLITNTEYTVFMTADTASKIKTTNDYTVICVWALCVKTAALCLLEVVRRRMIVPEILPEINRLKHKWKSRFIIVEEASSGITIIQEIMHTRRGEGMTVLPYSPHTGDKVARSNEAQIRMKNGQIFFPDTRDETIAECINEMLLFFTPDVHDDFVDNLSMAAWYASGQWRNKSTGTVASVVKRGFSPVSHFRIY